MRLPRFVLFVLAVLATVTARAGAAADPPVIFAYGVSSGEVTPISAVLWTRADREVVLTAEISTDPGFATKLTRTALASAANDFTAKALVLSLRPATRYFFRWRRGGSVSEAGTFVTAPLPWSSANLRFAWTGDSDSSRNSVGAPFFNNWETLNAARLDQPDFFLYLGDTIYSDFRAGGFLPDVTTLPEYRDLYKAGRDFPALRSLARSTSFYAMWDDHEVRSDWDAETVDPYFLGIGRKAFLEYMPLLDQQLIHDSGCATPPLFRVFPWGSAADIIIVDTRACRSASAAIICSGDLAPTMPSFLRPSFGLAPAPPPGCLAAINNASRTMLGQSQKALLKTALRLSHAKFKIVITPENIQQLWVLPYDTWEGYGAERAEILNFIRDEGIRNVLFLTTDGHQNIMKDVYVDRFTDPAPIAYEVMTGPIASVTWQNLITAAVGPSGVAAQQAIHNLLGAQCRHLDAYSYGVVDIDAVAGTAKVVLKDAAGHALHDQVTPSITCMKTLGP